MTMKLTAFIFVLILVVVVAHFLDNFDSDLYFKCNEEFNKVLEDIAAAHGDPEEYLKNNDCHLQAWHLLTPDKMLDYDKIKKLIPSMPELIDNDSKITEEIINNVFEKCKANAQGGTNAEIFTKIYNCLVYEVNSKI